MRKVVALPTANARLRNRRSGIIGSLTRRSQAAKATSRTAPETRQPMISALAQAPPGRESAAERVEPLLGAVAFRQQADRERQRGGSDRHVDPEDPVPVD